MHHRCRLYQLPARASLSQFPRLPCRHHLLLQYLIPERATVYECIRPLPLPSPRSFRLHLASRYHHLHLSIHPRDSPPTDPRRPRQRSTAFQLRQCPFAPRCIVRTYFHTSFDHAPLSCTRYFDFKAKLLGARDFLQKFVFGLYLYFLFGTTGSAIRKTSAPPFPARQILARRLTFLLGHAKDGHSCPARDEVY